MIATLGFSWWSCTITHARAWRFHGELKDEGIFKEIPSDHRKSMFESLVVKAKEAEEDAEKASGTGTLALVPPDLHHDSHSHDNGRDRICIYYRQIHQILDRWIWLHHIAYNLYNAINWLIPIDFDNYTESCCSESISLQMQPSCNQNSSAKRSRICHVCHDLDNSCKYGFNQLAWQTVNKKNLEGVRSIWHHNIKIGQVG